MLSEVSVRVAIVGGVCEVVFYWCDLVSGTVIWYGVSLDRLV
jgi:hypothetical protein